jgi:hypothetical protein
MADPRPNNTPPDALLESLLNTDESAVVAVLPSDTIDAVADKVRATGTRRVQLLVPDGVATFRASRSFLALQALLGSGAPSLLLVSGDEATLDAARRGRVEALGVAAPAPPHPSLRTPRPEAVTKPIDERDLEFLRDLDGAPDAPDDSPPPPPRRVPRRSTEDTLAELDRLSDQAASVTRRGATSTRRPAAPPARREQTRPRAAASATAIPARGRPRPSRYDEDEITPRRAPSTATLAMLVVIGLLVLGIAWAFTTRTTVFVTPPPGAARQVPFTNEAIPIAAQPGNGATIVAAPIAADAEFTLSAQVLGETISPIGRARGQVNVQNTLEQAIALPAGTELVGNNAVGEVVRFAIEQPVTLPPAARIPTNTGFNFVYGAATFEVVARSPGSASNVGANAIKQIIIPGQRPLVTDGPNQPIIRHEAIGGGTEEPQRIVTEAEVQRVLGEALTNLYRAGTGQLQNVAGEQTLVLDATTVRPSTVDLQQPTSYDQPVVSPPVGQPVDPNNPTFTVTVQTRFTGLATAQGASVEQQVGTVAAQHFSERPGAPCRPGERQEIPELRPAWDGERLVISGVVRCIPSNAVSQETVARVRGSLLGQSRIAAAATLDEFVRQGQIGGYRLPDRQELPRFEFLLDVQVDEGQPAGP